MYRIKNYFLYYVIKNFLDQPMPELIKLLSSLTADQFGPPLTGYPGSSGNNTSKQMMEGVLSTVSSNIHDSKSFVHIKVNFIFIKYYFFKNIFTSFKSIIIFIKIFLFKIRIRMKYIDFSKLKKIQ